MPRYSNYTAEDFAQDLSFRRWVQSPDAETNQFWASFLAQYPEKQAVMSTARALLLALAETQATPTSEQGRRMWDSIQQRTEEVSAPEETRFRLGWRPWAVAATVAAVLALGSWFVWRGIPQAPTATYAGGSEPAPDWAERANESKQPITIRLEDGSSVVLQPASRVQYPPHFDATKREVRLVGEGFFEVTKNPEKPFLVYANGLVTKVVGTSFRIVAFAKTSRVTVAVRTGKVAVFTLKAFNQAAQRRETIANVLLLSPNQQASFNTESDQLTKSLVKEPVLIKKPEDNQHFRFENTPVADVFRTLEEAYGVTIRYDAKVLRNCNLTAPLGDESLFRKLDLICQTIGATYEVWGTELIISGKGCSAP